MKRKKREIASAEKKVKEKQEKQVKLIVIMMISLVLIVVLVNWLLKESNKFEYAGLEFTKGKQGSLVLYFTQFPLKDLSGKTVAYLPFYFREDPRKLDRIKLEGMIRLKKVVALAADKEVIEGCEDTLLAAATLSLKFLKDLNIEAFAATPDKAEAEQFNRTYVDCNDTSKYSILIFKKGNESRIIQEGDCYTLEFDNCEIMNVSERFVINTYANSQGIELK
jgi:hypothetical protein